MIKKHIELNLQVWKLYKEFLTGIRTKDLEFSEEVWRGKSKIFKHHI